MTNGISLLFDSGQYRFEKIAEFGKENKLTAKLTIINIKWQRMRADPVKMPMFEFKIQPSAGIFFRVSCQ